MAMTNTFGKLCANSINFAQILQIVFVSAIFGLTLPFITPPFSLSQQSVSMLHGNDQHIWQIVRKFDQFGAKFANVVCFSTIFGLTPPFLTPPFDRFQQDAVFIGSKRLLGKKSGNRRKTNRVGRSRVGTLTLLVVAEACLKHGMRAMSVCACPLLLMLFHGSLPKYSRERVVSMWQTARTC